MLEAVCVRGLAVFSRQRPCVERLSPGTGQAGARGGEGAGRGGEPGRALSSRFRTYAPRTSCSQLISPFPALLRPTLSSPLVPATESPP